MLFLPKFEVASYWNESRQYIIPFLWNWFYLQFVIGNNGNWLVLLQWFCRYRLLHSTNGWLCQSHQNVATMRLQLKNLLKWTVAKGKANLIMLKAFSHLFQNKYISITLAMSRRRNRYDYVSHFCLLSCDNSDIFCSKRHHKVTSIKRKQTSKILFIQTISWRMSFCSKTISPTWSLN